MSATFTFSDFYASRNGSSTGSGSVDSSAPGASKHVLKLSSDATGAPITGGDGSKPGGGIPVIVLDGGMGTTVESMGHPEIKTSPLWAASVIDNDPDSIIKAHTAFLDAGVDIIITNTYQASNEQFERAGIDTSKAAQISRRAVELAAEARRAFLARRVPASATRSTFPQIALSLGSYGSTLKYAEEYDGIYPPPFGPQGVELPVSTSNPPPNVFNKSSNPTADEQKAEQVAQDALYEWYLNRLLIYASEPLVWASIDILAFETVPLLREALAIRRAVGEISRRYPSGDEETEGGVKPWWIGFTFPTGTFPQKEYVGGPPLSVTSLVKGVFSPLKTSEESGVEAPLPDAIGINCTSASFVGSIVKEMTAALSQEKTRSSAPWLVLYPNAGMEYNPSTRKWKHVKDAGSDWAEELVNEVRKGLTVDHDQSLGSSAADEGSRAWGGLILGGCCRTGPSEIAYLRTLVHHHDHPHHG